MPGNLEELWTRSFQRHHQNCWHLCCTAASSTEKRQEFMYCKTFFFSNQHEPTRLECSAVLLYEYLASEFLFLLVLLSLFPHFILVMKTFISVSCQSPTQRRQRNTPFARLVLRFFFSNFGVYPHSLTASNRQQVSCIPPSRTTCE